MSKSTDSYARLNQAAWRLAEALVGEVRHVVLGRSREIRDYLHFCWNSTRLWWVLRRCLAACLLFSFRREMRLVRLQQEVVRLALADPLDVRALEESIDIEYATRRQYQLGVNAHPVAMNILTRATDEGLPMTTIAWMLKHRRIRIHSKEGVEYRPPRWRKPLLSALLVGIVVWFSFIGVHIYRTSGATLLDLAFFVAVAAVAVGFFARQILLAINEEVDVVQRLKNIRAARSTRSRGLG
jgi:hypothetical protein